MDLDELRAFVAVAEAGSFAAAARTLRSPRAWVRRRVDELEARVGTALLLRTSQGASLTGAGELMLDQARSLLDDVPRLLTRVRDAHDVESPAGLVEMIIPAGMPPQILTSLVCKLQADLPDLRIAMHSSVDPANEPLGGRHLALHLGHGVPDDAEGVVRIGEVTEGLVAHRRFVEAHGEPADVDDLRKHPLWSWVPPGESAAIWPTGSGEPIRVEPVFCSPEIYAIRVGAARASGIARLPCPNLDDHLFDASVRVRVLPHIFNRKLPVSLIIPRELEGLAKVRVLVDRLKNDPVVKSVLASR